MHTERDIEIKIFNIIALQLNVANLFPPIFFFTSSSNAGMKKGRMCCKDYAASSYFLPQFSDDLTFPMFCWSEVRYFNQLFFVEAYKLVKEDSKKVFPPESRPNLSEQEDRCRSTFVRL